MASVNKNGPKLIRRMASKAPADITMRLARRYPQANVVGLDGADSMLDIAKNAILRHISLANRPLDLWRAIHALAAPEAAVLVMDLIRPQSFVEAKQIVEKYAGEEPEVLKDDFLNSLLAAYRPAEIMEQLVSVNMDFLQMEVVTDRHLIVFGSMR